MANLKTLQFDMYSPEFIGLTRTTYPEKYTPLEEASYSDEVKPIMAAFKTALGDPDSLPLTVLSEGGYIKSLLSPKIYKLGGSLVLKYGKEDPITVEATVSDNDEPYFTINGNKAALLNMDGKPGFSLSLKGGYKVILLCHTPVGVDKSTILRQLDAIEAGDYTGVSEYSEGGSTSFSALKNLPVGRYKVVSTTTDPNGKYGVRVRMTVINPETREIICSVKVGDSWGQEPIEVLSNTAIVVDANTHITRTLMGSDLVEDDEVVLEVVSKRIDKETGKVYVNASLDYSARIPF